MIRLHVTAARLAIAQEVNNTYLRIIETITDTLGSDQVMFTFATVAQHDYAAKISIVTDSTGDIPIITLLNQLLAAIPFFRRLTIHVSVSQGDRTLVTIHRPGCIE